RPRRTNLDRRPLRVEQMEVETLATEIQTGVQHCVGPPFVSRGRAEHVLPGRPFFMTFLTSPRGYESAGNREDPTREDDPRVPAGGRVDVRVAFARVVDFLDNYAWPALANTPAPRL